MATQIFINPYPYLGKDNTQGGTILNGSILLYGSYPSGGDPLNWTNIVSGFSYNELNPIGLGNALANAGAQVTALSASGGVITATAKNDFIVGQQVKFVGCTTTLGLLLNGQTVTVATASATQFTFSNAATGTGSSETGIVVSGLTPSLIGYSSNLLVAPVTTFSASGGVVTATAANNFLPGAQVTFQNCVTTLGLLLNGKTVTVSSATATAFKFTSSATGTGTSETGQGNGYNPVVPFVFDAWSAKASGYTYAIDPSGNLHVQQGAATASNPNADISAGAYGATLLADIVRFQAIIARQ